MPGLTPVVEPLGFILVKYKKITKNAFSFKILLPEKIGVNFKMKKIKITNLKHEVNFLPSDLIKITEDRLQLKAVWTSCKNSKKIGRPRGSKTKAKKRTQNSYSLRKTFERNSSLINANFYGKEGEFFITATYKNQEVQGKEGVKKVAKDFDCFIHSLKYHFKKNGQFKWFLALEPTGQRVWHLHLLLKLDPKIKFLSSDYVEKLWGKGFVQVKALQGITGVAAYVTKLASYLTPTTGGKGSDHMKEKSARLVTYPAGTKLCRHSRNLSKPRVFYCHWDSLKTIAALEGWKKQAEFSCTITTSQKIKNPATGEEENFALDFKKMTFVRSPEVAEKARLLYKLKKTSPALYTATLAGRTPAEFLQE